MKITAFILAFAAAVSGGEMDALVADRTAIERVYHNHRTGTQRSFEETMPEALLRRNVALDLKKEAVLRARYDVEVTPAMVQAEMQRIDATTRAPEMLAEIKRALGDDAARFARSVARLIVVERELRRRFGNDDALNAPQRAEGEEARSRLAKGESIASASGVTWRFGPRPAGTQPPPPSGPVTATTSGGIYSNTATAQVAVPLTKPEGGPDTERLYFEDLDPELLEVLRTQLRKPGDISALVESAGAFLVFRATAISDDAISADVVSIPKRNFDQWLAEQP